MIARRAVRRAVSAQTVRGTAAIGPSLFSLPAKGLPLAQIRTSSDSDAAFPK